MLKALGNAAKRDKLNRDLLEYKTKRRFKQADVDDMEDALKKLRKKRQEIEEGLQETSDTIEKWVSRLPNNCKFRYRYHEQAKNKFLNPDSSKALEHTLESEGKAEKKLEKLQDELDAINKKIREIEKKIEALS